VTRHITESRFLAILYILYNYAKLNLVLMWFDECSCACNDND